MGCTCIVTSVPLFWETFWLKEELKKSLVCVESEIEATGVKNILFISCLGMKQTLFPNFRWENRFLPGHSSQSLSAGAGIQAVLTLSLYFCCNTTCFIINISTWLLGPELSMAGLPLTFLKQTWRFQEAVVCSELRENGQGRKSQLKLRMRSLGYLGKMAVPQWTYNPFINIKLKTVCWIV